MGQSKAAEWLRPEQASCEKQQELSHVLTTCDGKADPKASDCFNVMEWEVHLSRNDSATPMGLALLCHFGRIAVVQSVNNGVVKQYNQTSPMLSDGRKCDVRPGDIIVKVNECKDDAQQFVYLFRKELRLTLKVRSLL